MKGGHRGEKVSLSMKPWRWLPNKEALQRRQLRPETRQSAPQLSLGTRRLKVRRMRNSNKIYWRTCNVSAPCGVPWMEPGSLAMGKCGEDDVGAKSERPIIFADRLTPALDNAEQLPVSGEKASETRPTNAPRLRAQTVSSSEFTRLRNLWALRRTLHMQLTRKQTNLGAALYAAPQADTSDLSQVRATQRHTKGTRRRLTSPLRLSLPLSRPSVPKQSQ